VNKTEIPPKILAVFYMKEEIMKIRKSLSAGLAILLISILSVPVMIQASEFNFTVSPVIPENQIEKGKTYFDLMLEKGASQDIEVLLRNDKEEDIVVEAKIHSATTNLNGVVEYGDNDIQPDETLKYDMHEIAAVESEVTIPAKSEISLPIHIQMPEEEFKGLIAGGITLQEKEPADKKENQEGSGVSIQNKYSYVIAILLRGSEEEVLPELQMNDAWPGQINARNVINFNLQNISPIYINNMKVDAQITEKGKTQVLYSSLKESLQMAPNTNFDYPIPLEGERIKAGDYTVNVVINSGDQEWKFTKDFHIDKEEAKKLNDSDVSIEKVDYTWWIIGGIGAILLLTAFIIILLVFMNKNKKNKEKRLELEKKLEELQKIQEKDKLEE
jgi:hypothetical protein